MQQTQTTEQVAQEYRLLKYTYSDEEIKEMGESLSEDVIEFTKLELEKKEQNKIWNKELKERMSEIKRMSIIIDQGWVEAEVKCKVEYNNPVYGRKRITRMDTQEAWFEDMDESEFDLFTQDQQGGDTYPVKAEDYLPFQDVDEDEEGFDNDKNELPAWLREEE